MTSIGSVDNPLRVAIVGSGPSGFYAAEALLKSDRKVEVDMYERLPVPYGLVRSGVAPDHPKLKQAMQVYARIAESPGFHFFGHVTIGKDISITDLQKIYHAVIFSCGAEADRKLGIPGEELPGSHTATEFVGWYNGHPDYRDRNFDLSGEVALIFGQGNVAADVSRILAKTPDELQHTDIAEHALMELSESRIRDIYVIGRRGPAQAKFTSKELKEFGELNDCAPVVDPVELELNAASEAELADKTSTVNRKVYELFKGFASQKPMPHKGKRVHFTFLKSPVEFSGNGRVEKVHLEHNHLDGEPFNQRARGSGKIVDIDAGIVFRSIGYRGVPFPDLPFDDTGGIIPNDNGRVTEHGTVLPGLYVAGWIKRGATGIIGTNRADSVATVNALLADMDSLPAQEAKPGHGAAQALLEQSGIAFVTFDDWKIIDQAEIERGAPKQKPREKFTAIEEMLDTLK